MTGGARRYAKGGGQDTVKSRLGVTQASRSSVRSPFNRVPTTSYSLSIVGLTMTPSCTVSALERFKG